MTGGMHGRRACVVGGLPGRGRACRRHNHLSMHPIGMHSCFK